jgi:intergrase/recombinase
MFKIVAIFFISLSVGVTSLKRVHPLFVSNTDVEYNSKEKSIEIISKIFMDDLESILKKNTGKKIDLFATQNEIAKSAILKYLQDNLQINIDAKNYTFNLIGYERKKEACWVYLEIAKVNQPKKINIANSILYDFTNKEINLMHVTVNGVTKSNKVAYPEKNAEFVF